MGLLFRRALLLVLMSASMLALAEDQLKVGKVEPGIVLEPGKPFLHVLHNGRSVKVQRIQDPDYHVERLFRPYRS